MEWCLERKCFLIRRVVISCTYCHQLDKNLFRYHEYVLLWTFWLFASFDNVSFLKQYLPTYWNHSWKFSIRLFFKNRLPKNVHHHAVGNCLNSTARCLMLMVVSMVVVVFMMVVMFMNMMMGNTTRRRRSKNCIGRNGCRLRNRHGSWFIRLGCFWGRNCRSRRGRYSV